MIEDYDYIDLLFEDEETGEQFFVELNTNGKTREELVSEAITIAYDNFEAPHFCYFVDPVSAEEWGLDTY